VNEMFVLAEDEVIEFDSNYPVVDGAGRRGHCYVCEAKLDKTAVSVPDKHEQAIHFCATCFARWQLLEKQEALTFEPGPWYREVPETCKRCSQPAKCHRCPRDGVFGTAIKHGVRYTVTAETDGALRIVGEDGATQFCQADFFRVPVSPVTSATISVGDRTSFSWDGSREADRYHIYHVVGSPDDAATRTPIAVTNNTSWAYPLNLKSGDHRFSVVAVDSNGRKSPPTFVDVAIDDE
jgi:hypothetical protein